MHEKLSTQAPRFWRLSGFLLNPLENGFRPDQDIPPAKAKQAANSGTNDAAYGGAGTTSSAKFSP